MWQSGVSTGAVHRIQVMIVLQFEDDFLSSHMPEQLPQDTVHLLPAVAGGEWVLLGPLLKVFCLKAL